MSWQTKEVLPIYDNPWINVAEHQVINPSGGDGIYGVVRFKNLAIGIIPLDKEGYTWLVGQYRYPLGQYSWEIPEGGCPMGSDPLETAMRELQEETGLKAHRWQQLLEMHVTNSVSDEYAYIYVAQDLELGETEHEDTEDISVKRLPFEEAFRMVMRGEITDSLSVAAILKTKIWLEAEK